MRTFGGYVFRQLAVAALIICVVLTAIAWIAYSLRFVDMIVNSGISAGLLFRMTMLLLPMVLIFVLPLSLVFAIVFVYGKLTMDRELVVMCAAGRSQGELARPALILTAIVAVIAYALNLYAMPKANQLFGELQWEIRYGPAHLLIQEGAFTPVADGITSYVRERASDGSLKGILIHDDRNPDASVTLIAEQGALVRAASGPRVMLFKGSRQEWDRAAKSFSVLYFDSYSMDIEVGFTRPEVRHRKPFERTIDELLAPEDDPSISPSDYRLYRGEMHKRLASPLYAVAFALFALACMLGGGLDRRRQVRRAAAAIAGLVAMMIVFLGIENLVLKSPALAPALYGVIGVAIAGSYALLLHRHRLRALAVRVGTPSRGG